MDEVDIAALRRVFARYPGVAAVWLFGSHARGEARPARDDRPASDLDLAVEPADPSVRERKLDMLTDLVKAGFEDVDLVILDRDDPVLRYEAIGPNVVVYAAPGYDTAEAWVQALRRYLDTAPLRKRVREAYYERLLADDE